MKIISSAFQNNSLIPSKFTCDGDNINPPLEFSNIPDGTKSLVLVVEDPDAPNDTFTHWVMWNIDPHTAKVEENSYPDSAVIGTNSAGKQHYFGPCPPSGTHRYIFRLYSLNKTLNLGPESKSNEVRIAYSGSVLDEAQLIGLYSAK